MRRQWRVGTIIATIVALTAFGTFLYIDNTGTTHVIDSSYIFDVTNPQFVAGYADDVFFATVEEALETQADRQRTLYTVRVQESFKGDLVGRVVVRQLGYVSRGDRYALDDQPMLQEGQSYLLATTRADSGQHTVIGGPESAVLVTRSSTERVKSKWTVAVAAQQFPPGVPR